MNSMNIISGAAWWLSEQRLVAALIIVCVQIALLYAIGRTATQFGRVSSMTTSRLWLATIALMWLIAPIHWLIGGWPITVTQADATQASTSELSEAMLESTSAPVDVSSDSLEIRIPVDSESNAWNTEINSGDRTERELESTEPGFQAATNSAQPLDQTERGLSVSDSQASASFVTRSRSIIWQPASLLLIYGLGVVLLSLRFVFATWRLSRACGAAVAASEQTMALCLNAAQELGWNTDFGRLPRILLSDSVRMPMACGILRPTVLLPGDFETYSRDTQKTVLSHELTHLQRQDVLGELAARCLRILYWFHPAVWLAGRQLRITRELATDEQVVRSGADPYAYANGIISVLERIGQSRSAGVKFPGVAMSAESDVKSRIQYILSLSSTRKPSRLVALGLVAMPVLAICLTTIQLRQTVAQETPPVQLSVSQQARLDSPKPSEWKVSADGLVRIDPATLTNRVSLVEQIRNCSVFPVTGDDHGPIFTVSGQVRLPNGEPADGAVVVLRESPQKRVSANPTFLSVPQRQFAAIPDVFAKTISDDQGMYRFDRIPSPSIPMRWTSGWGWDVMAATESGHVGFKTFRPQVQAFKRRDDLSIDLAETVTISGVVMGDDEQPLADAVACLSSLADSMINELALVDNEAQIWMSVLFPLARTGSDGRFEFAGVPKSMVASVNTYHPIFAGGVAQVATSEDIPLGKSTDPRLRRGNDLEVVASPAVIKLERNIIRKGVVTAEGVPVPGAKVRFSPSVDVAKTDASGEFELTYSPKQLTQYKANNATLVIQPPENSGLLSEYASVPFEQLEEGADTPLTFELKRGVRLKGTVLCNGEPVEGIRITTLRNASDFPMSWGGATDSEGKYEFTVPARQTTVYLSTEEAGYKLPSLNDVWRTTDDGVPFEWPHQTCNLDSSDIGKTIELDPIEVEANDTLRVMVLLPDGSPAQDANVIAIDSRVVGESRLATTRKVELSQSTSTDENGVAEVLLKGLPSSEARIAAVLNTQDESYFGEVAFTASDAGEITIPLELGWKVRGRVTLNGKPLAGVSVEIGQSEPVPGRRNASRTSNFVIAETDETGRYEAAVEPNKRYSARLSSVPGLNNFIGVGFLGRATDLEKRVLEIKEFALLKGEGEIAGFVYDDRNGKPVPNVRVQISNDVNVTTGLWIGRDGSSQFETDETGRFHLRNVPEGTYELNAFGPRDETGRSNFAQAEASTGDTAVRILLSTEKRPPIPRLKPQRITDF